MILTISISKKTRKLFEGDVESCLQNLFKNHSFSIIFQNRRKEIKKKDFNSKMME